MAANLHPSRLPKVRDQLIHHEQDHDSYLWRIAQYDALGYDRNDLETAHGHLHDATLYYATEDMSALAMSAGRTLPGARWAIVDRPTPNGLIWWEGGTGLVTSSGWGTIPIDACSWGTAPDGQMLLWCYVARRRLIEQARDPQTQAMLPGLDLEAMFPPLVPLANFHIPVTAEAIPIDEHPGPRPMCATLAAAWLLMAQPTLAERRTEPADRTLRRSYARQGRRDPAVTIVDLRRLYRPQQDESDTEPSRVYRHRWVVGGHWRHYAAPRYSDERRESPQWIPDYIKGPDGAPLLRTERVNVWRR